METKSRKLRAKIEQGYQDNQNMCANCFHFDQQYCWFGGFEVYKNAVCSKHERETEKF